MINEEQWKKKRYSLFNEKIDYFKGHPKYEWLRKYADDALRFCELSGIFAIRAMDFIERIEARPIYHIKEWLDGKSDLN